MKIEEEIEKKLVYTKLDSIFYLFYCKNENSRKKLYAKIIIQGGFKVTLDQAKQELIKRYRYLYENAYFVLAPYMYEQSEEEFKRQIDENI